MSRLIDADALESVDFSECTDSMEIMAVIDAQPTAYDVDKVIEQLEELNDNEFTYAAVMAIVRGGGVNE